MDDLSITPISNTAATGYLHAAARRLCCGNMLATYKRHGMNWDDEQFAECWRDNENFAIRVNGEWVGFLSLKALPDMLYLRDLQLLPHWQGRGIGSACLDWLITRVCQPDTTRPVGMTIDEATDHQHRALRLRVFSDSPALGLYKRHGFVLVNEQSTPTRGGNILAMEKRVTLDRGELGTSEARQYQGIATAAVQAAMLNSRNSASHNVS